MRPVSRPAASAPYASPVVAPVLIADYLQSSWWRWYVDMLKAGEAGNRPLPRPAPAAPPFPAGVTGAPMQDQGVPPSPEELRGQINDLSRKILQGRAEGHDGLAEYATLENAAERLLGQNATVPPVGSWRPAIGPLIAGLGPYCSYCERLLISGAEVEHVLPKAAAGGFPWLGREWSNFLIACPVCNVRKNAEPPMSQLFHELTIDRNLLIQPPAPAVATVVSQGRERVCFPDDLSYDRFIRFFTYELRRVGASLEPSDTELIPCFLDRAREGGIREVDPPTHKPINGSRVMAEEPPDGAIWAAIRIPVNREPGQTDREQLIQGWAKQRLHAQPDAAAPMGSWTAKQDEANAFVWQRIFTLVAGRTGVTITEASQPAGAAPLPSLNYAGRGSNPESSGMAATYNQKDLIGQLRKEGHLPYAMTDWYGLPHTGYRIFPTALDTVVVEHKVIFRTGGEFIPDSAEEECPVTLTIRRTDIGGARSTATLALLQLNRGGGGDIPGRMYDRRAYWRTKTWLDAVRSLHTTLSAPNDTPAAYTTLMVNAIAGRISAEGHWTVWKDVVDRVFPLAGMTAIRQVLTDPSVFPGTRAPQGVG